MNGMQGDGCHEHQRNPKIDMAGIGIAGLFHLLIAVELMPFAKALLSSPLIHTPGCGSYLQEVAK